MAKETVRYPDELVANIEDLVAESDAFESKSEFHRFASEFLLTLLDGDHTPSVLGYGDILDDIETTLPDPEAAAAEDGVAFLEAYATVRRHLLRGDPEAARAYVDDAYAVTDREAVLLEEFIAARDGRDAPADANAGEGRNEGAGISVRGVSGETDAGSRSGSEGDGESGRHGHDGNGERERELGPTEIRTADPSSD